MSKPACLARRAAAVLLLSVAALTAATAPAAAQTISTVALTSNAGTDATYAIGNDVVATVTFTEAVDVTGTPELALNVGGFTKDAECAAGTNVLTMACTYEVDENDEDTNGISIDAGSVALIGGSIKKAGDTAVNATLSHTGAAADADHKVDGVRPTLLTAATSNTGATIILTFSETLRKTTALSGAFAVTVNTASRDVESVAVNGEELTLTLASAVAHGETVTVGYTDPGTGDDWRAVQDLAWNDAASFSGETVTNDVPAVAVAVPAAPARPELAVKGALTIEVDWTEPADNGNDITSVNLTSKIGLRLLGTPTVTKPAPTRDAAWLVKAAAPVIPVDAAITKTRPYVPLCEWR